MPPSRALWFRVVTPHLRLAKPWRPPDAGRHLVIEPRFARPAPCVELAREPLDHVPPAGVPSAATPSSSPRSARPDVKYKTLKEDVVAAGLAKRCEVPIAYAIGVGQPVGVHVTTYGTGKVSDESLERYILKNFDMRPKALIEELELLRPGYKRTAAYGHFGRPEFSCGEDDARRQARRRPAPVHQRRRRHEEESEPQGGYERARRVSAPPNRPSAGEDRPPTGPSAT